MKNEAFNFYSNHGIFECRAGRRVPRIWINFQIPRGWYVAQNNTTGTANDTKIVLTDDESAIRIDIVALPQMTWLRSLSDGHSDFDIYGVVMNYYKKNILKQDISIFSISSTRKVSPDGLRDLVFGMTQMGDEWIIAWSKPEYGEKFIGMHVIFTGEQNTTEIGYEGSDYKYPMPDILYNLLNDFSTDFNYSKRIFDDRENITATI